MKSLIIIYFIFANFALANFFGPSDRMKVSANDPTRMLIGKLVTPGNSICTGSMIAEDLVLTAAHCLYSSMNVQMKGTFFFELGRIGNNNYIFRSPVIAIYLPASAQNNSYDLNEDFAILKINHRLDPRIKPFEVISLNRRSMKRQNLQLAGYGSLSGSDALTITNNSCYVSSYPVFQSMVYHSCDMSSGDSGAPLFNCDNNGCYIYALNVSELRAVGATSSHQLESWSRTYTNIAIAAKKFQAFVDSVINEY